MSTSEATLSVEQSESAGSQAMLRFQSNLPRLPVPSLPSTIAKLLDSTRPHVTLQEFSATKLAATDFLESDQGAELQRRLQARAADPSVTNWISDWWDRYAYMEFREPLVFNVSCYMVHADDTRRRTLSTRAASLTKSMMLFSDLVETRKLEPEIVNGTPLCMNSYERLFYTCRYPAKPYDYAKKYDPSTNDHAIFIRKNKFYVVSLVGPTGTRLSVAELEVQIDRVVELAGEEKGVPIGALTSDHRDTWTESRKDLLAASPQNQASLSVIETAAIVIALDDTRPTTKEEAAWAMWAGDGRNRFYDKHQLIICENGVSGHLGEHSCMDGMAHLRENEFTIAAIANGKVDLGPERNDRTGSNLPPPKELLFVINEKVREHVEGSCKRFDESAAEYEIHAVRFDGYGKQLMKEFKISPDAWVQLIMQLAFHKMNGRPVVTYEAAHTRKFQLGRTEVIRAASNESKAWAEAMLDPLQDNDARASLFRNAVTRHKQYAAWAADAQGVDRHLMGLRLSLKEGEPVPKIFDDAGLTKSKHWELSSSQLSSPYIAGTGFGPVVPDGFGAWYGIADDYIRWNIASKTRNSSTLGRYLIEAADQTKAMMEGAASARL